MPTSILPELRRVAATATAAATLVAGRHTPANATSGPFTLTLPAPAREGEVISVEKTDVSANAITVAGNIRGVTGTLVFPWRGDSVELISDANGSWWPTMQGHTKASLDAAYSGGGITANTLANAAPGTYFACPIDGSVTTSSATLRPSTRTDIFFIWNTTVQPANDLNGDKIDLVGP